MVANASLGLKRQSQIVPTEPKLLIDFTESVYLGGRLIRQLCFLQQPLTAFLFQPHLSVTKTLLS